MSFTYDITTDRGRVRVKIGDTTDSGHFLEDAEIDYCLTEANSNINLAASYACELIAAECAKDAGTKEVGDLKIELTERAKTYLQMSQTFKKRASSTASPYCGGISVSDKDDAESDSDRVKPFFSREQHNYNKSTDYDGSDD